MDSQRTGNGYGPNPIGFEAINAWSQVRGVRLLQWQVDAIIRMDLKRREVLSKSNDDSEVPEEPTTISAQPLTSKSMAYLFPGERIRFAPDGTRLN